MFESTSRYFFIPLCFCNQFCYFCIYCSHNSQNLVWRNPLFFFVLGWVLRGICLVQATHLSL